MYQLVVHNCGIHLRRNRGVILINFFQEKAPLLTTCEGSVNIVPH